MEPIINPRAGDIEDDVSSTKRRSLTAIAGSLLAEISLPKLLVAWALLVVLPGLLLGLAPLVAFAWLREVSEQLVSLLTTWVAALAIGAGVLLAWFGGRPLFDLAERNFWSLAALIVQPGYALIREGLRHLFAKSRRESQTPRRQAWIGAVTAASAGVLMCAFALAVLIAAWPSSRWLGDVADLREPVRLIMPAFANSVVLVSAYCAGFAIVWGFADASMAQAHDLEREAMARPAAAGDRVWRVAHLSDLHVVGEHYGFRIECGRNGPRGNGRAAATLAELDRIHGETPLDLVMITGDMTDAGRSAEWAEFMDGLGKYPALAQRTLVLPGNHDVNIVDRTNPARLDLPGSPMKRLRQMRCLSAMAALQGKRVRVVDLAKGRLGGTLDEALEPHRETMRRFADKGTMRDSRRLAKLWADVFPMVVPPDGDNGSGGEFDDGFGDGLGIVILNSNADTHFSFTNALGMVSLSQAQALRIVTAQYPGSRWIVALHHHLIEYPTPTNVFSERIGTALINGTWFARELHRLDDRVVIMHGHRHIDWIGRCGGLLIASAPSPVMNAEASGKAGFRIHTLVGDAKEHKLHLAHSRWVPIVLS